MHDTLFGYPHVSLYKYMHVSGWAYVTRDSSPNKYISYLSEHMSRRKANSRKELHSREETKKGGWE